MTSTETSIETSTKSSIKTLCPYCGVGCGLEVLGETGDALPANSSNWKVRGDRTHPSNVGMVCVKGATIAESLDKNRLLYPMFRESLDQPFQRVSWEEALEKICDRIRLVQQEQGVDSICMYGSGQLQTEDYYVAQKLLKGCLGTNNFDSNSRLCMSSAVSGYLRSLGSDGPPCCYEDLDLTDCAFLIGTNTADCHPIVFNRLRKHHKQDAQMKLIVVDPRRTATAEVADLHLPINPGTDIDLLNGIAYLLWQGGKIDQEFIASHTNNSSAFIELLQHYPPEKVAQICGIPQADLELAAQYWGESARVLSLWSMGVNQSSEGTAKVNSIINLHLLTGAIGKPGCGPFSLTGQPNAMGGRESGGLSKLLPGYRLVSNPQHRQEVEEFWGVPAGRISAQPGRTAWEIITGLETDDVGLLWIVATNPAVSMPDLARTKKALERSPFTIYQDAYHPTETTQYAHLLLPAAQWGEKTGTMTNSERYVTLCAAFQQPPGEARADWEIFADVGRRLGFTELLPFQNAEAVHTEYVQSTKDRVCDQTGISYEKLKISPRQWPLSASSSLRYPLGKDSQARLYTDWKFPTPNGRANFIPHHSRGLAEPIDGDYPFILTVGRLYGHWHTQTRTGRIEKIRKMHPEPFLEIHPRDAEKLGIVQGELVEVYSRRGRAQFPVLVTRAIAPGTVFAPLHWGSLWADNAEANALTHAISCPDSLQPELKACAVQIKKVDFERVL